MRKQIAAANWKMNLTYQQGEALLDAILDEEIALDDHRRVVIAVPFPYLIMAQSELSDRPHYFAAAQNCSDKPSGAFTGEVSAEMLRSIGLSYCVLGHSERREYFFETNQALVQKINLCLERDITPIFCCGEPLAIREAGTQDHFVQTQLEESLFSFPADKVREIVIAYEPIWAIGTGKTATTAQAQEMHAFIRSSLAAKYGKATAEDVSILYGGSVKAGNAKELFDCPDVDGGLVGGASLVAADFIQIIRSLK
jgi:triosephosphate isomerase (TIM)